MGEKMKQLLYKNQFYSAKELSDLTGVNYTTLTERLKRGYTVEEAVTDSPRIPESVKEFFEHSYYQDWDRLTTDSLYNVYFQWCLKSEYKPETKIHFIKSLRRIIPNLRVVTARIKNYDQVVYKRIIRIN